MRYMSHPITSAILVVFATTVFNIAVDKAVAGPGAWEVGARGAWSYDEKNESFSQYDIFANAPSSMSLQWGGVVQVDGQLTGAVGILEGGGETGVVGSLGFVLVFGPASGECPFEIRAGSGLTLIGEDQYGDKDFGGPVQFTSHIGVNWWILENLSALARVQHMSNADVYDENPGLNMIMLRFAYRF